MSVIKSKSRLNTTTGKMEAWDGNSYVTIPVTDLDTAAIPRADALTALGITTYADVATGDAAVAVGDIFYSTATTALHIRMV
jgi:hypothetical protein